MLASLESAAAQFPGRGRLRGILPTMVDYREPVAQEILADLRVNLRDKLLRTVIVRDASLVEAASFGRSVFQHCPFSKSALCYADLVKEIVDG
jgi:chromosome partitioning protein